MSISDEEYINKHNDLIKANKKIHEAFLFEPQRHLMFLRNGYTTHRMSFGDDARIVVIFTEQCKQFILPLTLAECKSFAQGLMNYTL